LARRLRCSDSSSWASSQCDRKLTCGSSSKRPQHQAAQAEAKQHDRGYKYQLAMSILTHSPFIPSRGC
jgi:hypothetical protein